MTPKNGDGIPIKTALQQSVQQRTTAEGDAPSFMTYLLQWAESDELPAWWTPYRDQELRRLWRKDGILASTIASMQAVLSTVGWTVEGASEQKVAAARQPLDNAEFGEGLKVAIKKWVEDWFTQDNGIFGEILGPGDPAGPLTEPPTGIAHLDAGRCWRSRDPEYPVWYLNERTNKWHKLHWTRVFFAAANPSAMEIARGVGYCAVSRMATLSRMMRDTIRYKAEKIGGRQTRAIVTVSGAPKEAVQLAIEEAERVADNAGQVKFSALPIIAAPGSGATIEAKILELAGVPDGFEWRDEVTLYMFILALAFGVDARELWPASASGATKSDAEVQHRKAMVKGMGDFLTTLSDIFNRRLMPDGVTHKFAPKDRDEDQAQADLEETRINAAKTMKDAGIVTAKGAVTYLVNAGVLPKEYLDQQDLAATAPEAEPAPSDGGEPQTETNVDEGQSGGGKPTAANETGTSGKSLGQRLASWFKRALMPKKKASPASAPPFGQLSGATTRVS